MWADRHPVLLVAGILAVVCLFVLLLKIFDPSPTAQERLQQRTHYITKTLPNGHTIPCVVLDNNVDDSISCNWSK